MKVLRQTVTFFQGDVSADKIVPPSGYTAWLTICASAAMAFLAVLAVVLSLTAQRVAERWADALSRVSTIELPGGSDADLGQLLELLNTTPGVSAAAEIDVERQKALLEPWLGTDFPVEALDLPRLVEFREDSSLDREGLALRIEGEFPDAVFLGHSEQQRSAATQALRLRIIGWIAVLITGLVMAIIITLAASTALAAHARVIETLRLIGARDDFISRAFVRRFTIRGVIGAAIGTLIGVITLIILSLTHADGSVSLVPGAAGWILIALIPVSASVIAFLATRASAARVLARLT